MRKARSRETFLGIGMNTPMVLTGKEAVIADDAGLVAVYPYRDSARTAVTNATRAIVFLACGVPGIPRGVLVRAQDVTRDLVLRFSGPMDQALA